jgi:HEAT repeat protein
MDSMTRKIVKMLSHDKIDRRCAAAMVLAELRVKDPEAVEALGQCLTEENRPLQLYSLDALSGIRSPKVTALMTPLLDHPDEDIRAQASAILASQGSKAVAALSKELQGAPLTRRRIIVSILSRNHEGETLDLLLRLLPDPELGEYALNALRSEVEHMSESEASVLYEKATLLLKDKNWQKDPSGMGRTLRLIGYLRNPRSVKVILPFADTKNPYPVRIAALAALRRPLAAANGNEKIVETLLEYADDADPTLARAVLDTLKGQKLAEGSTAQLLKLSRSRHTETRTFALEALGRSGDQKGIKSLLSHLRGNDPVARDAATRALGHMEGAAQALLKELESALEDPTQVGLLCRLLRGHLKEMKPAAHKTITGLAVMALEQDKPAAAPLLDFLAVSDPQGYAQALMQRALIHRKAKRYTQALALLTRLQSKNLLDDEGRYAALVCGLAALPNKKDLGRANRSTDPVLRLIGELLSTGTNVAAKLKKEKTLEAEELFFLGFNYSESKDEDEKDFGGALLSHLATTSPRSKLGRSAKNKLHLVGLDE